MYKRQGKILIGRRTKDPFIPKLSWCFPGGRPGYKKDLEYYLKLEVRKKTNLKIEVEKIVFARTHPENKKFLSIYYLTKPLNVGEERPGEKFVEIKWIRPTEVTKYFTTSVDDEILKFLNELENIKTFPKQ